MKKGGPLKNDFFDPASLALEDENAELQDETGTSARVFSLEEIGAITPGALQIEPDGALQIEPDGPHRIQGDFRDPIEEINAAGVAAEVEAEAEAHTPEFSINPMTSAPAHSAPAAAQPVNPAASEWATVNGHGEFERRAEMYENLFGLVLCELPFAELTRACMEAIANAVHADSASVLEIDREKQEFFFRAVMGEGSEKLQSVRLPQGSGFASDVAASLRAELVQDAAADQRFRHSVSTMAGTSVTNAMAAPVVVGDELFGVIEVFNKHAGEAFSDFDLATLERGAAILGKILEVRFFAAWMVHRD